MSDLLLQEPDLIVYIWTLLSLALGALSIQAFVLLLRRRRGTRALPVFDHLHACKINDEEDK